MIEKKAFLSDIRGTPVIAVPSFSIDLQRGFGAQFLRGEKLWLYPAFYPYGQFVMNDLRIIDEDIEFTEALSDWEVKLADTGDAIAERRLDRDFQWVTNPYDHQVESLVFSVYNLRTGLLLGCGLGKTKIVIDLIRYIKHLNQKGLTAESWKTLVLVPKVIMYKWAREVTFHSGGDLKPLVLDKTPKRNADLLTQADYDVLIATYGTAGSAKFTEPLYQHGDYSIIVADESHNLQTPTSGKTKSAMYLAQKAPRRVIMSGTASLGNPVHLYGQLKFLGPYNVESSVFKFKRRFLVSKDPKMHLVTGYKNLDILHNRVARTSIQYKSEDCLDLPDISYVDTYYKPTPAQRKLYNELVMASAEELEEKLGVIDVATYATRLTKLRQILSGFLVHSNKNPRICDGCDYVDACVVNEIKPYTPRCTVVSEEPEKTIDRFKPNPKLDAFQELIDSIMVEPSNKAIVWSYFLEDLNAIERVLLDKKLGYVRVDGGVSGADAEASNNAFLTDPDTRVYLGQIASGVGTDLVSANYTIYYSLTYDLGHYEQSLFRFYRIGQERKVTVYRLLAEGSVEEYIARSLEKKENIADALTTKAPCLTCKFNTQCVDKGIKLFDPDCVHDKQVSRVITKAQVLAP